MGALCPGMRGGEGGVARGPACYGLVTTGWSSHLELSRYRPELWMSFTGERQAGVLIPTTPFMSKACWTCTRGLTVGLRKYTGFPQLTLPITAVTGSLPHQCRLRLPGDRQAGLAGVRRIPGMTVPRLGPRRRSLPEYHSGRTGTHESSGLGSIGPLSPLPRSPCDPGRHPRQVYGLRVLWQAFP